MSCVTLKPRYSLVGKSLIPVILQMKALADPVPEKDLARLKKDHCLTKYSVEELIGHFEGLAGENLHEVVRLSGKDENIANIRSLLHFSIIHANVVGAPKSQPLREILTPSPSTSVEKVSHPSDEGQPHECREGEDSFEVRLKAMEKKVEKATNQSAESQVEECLKQVRILAARPNLTQPHVLLAAVETLVGVAVKVGHKDADFYSKAYVNCKKFEEAKDLCGLTLKLFGSSEDKKIASVVAEWAKSKKYEEPSKLKETSGSDIMDSKNSQNASTLSWQQYPHMYPGSFAPGSFFPYPMPYSRNFAGYQGNFNRPPMRGRRGPRGRCLYCKESGHFVAECPKIKKE